VRVRNVATIGGHLAHADPHMDLPPVLIALGAVIHATSRRGGRHIPVQDLYTGYYETALARDELIDEIVIPPQRQRYSGYVKFSTRAVHDWPAVGVAVSFGLVDNLAHDARVVVSAATERPIRAMAAEHALNGHPIDAASLRRAASAAADTIETIGDARGSRAYKKQLVGVHVERALQIAAGTVGVAQQ
jgi:aerobic carbon-monoxide dehydrogenase medium subunit